MTRFLIAIVVFLLLAIYIAIHFLLVSRKRSRTSWQEMFDRLILVDQESMKMVAQDLIDESGVRRHDHNAMSLQVDEVWSLIGGLSGLEVLENNSNVLIDMAAYLQTWHPEALLAAEELRLSAREMKWNIDRLKAALRLEKEIVTWGFYAQDAIITYHHMTQKLLTLYKLTGAPQLSMLKEAL